MDKVQRASIIEELELRIFKVLVLYLESAKAEQLAIGYFDECEDNLLSDLMNMPAHYWEEEASELIDRATQAGKL